VTALGLLFVSGTRTKYLVLAVLVTAPVIWKVLITGTSWRMLRLLAFLEPEKYCKTAGYQLCESLISIGSGGVLGQGLGQSRNKLFFLPEAHTDFILAIVGEELGLLGILFVVMGFGILVWRGLLAAVRARDVFGSYLAFGLTSLFGLQALVNMAVVMGLLPTKGLPLPGQSLVPSFTHTETTPRTLFWEHEGNRAVRQGDWKLVAHRDAPWELYDLRKDRTEMHDRSGEQPERVAELKSLWDAWAAKSGVLPYPVPTLEAAVETN
jgi:hypothetical protein